MGQTDRCQSGGADEVKDGKGINQRKFISSPWARAKIWELT